MTKPIARRAREIGIDDDLYELLLDSQEGHCALCATAPKTRRLNVDHNHRSGNVRGLLCHRCNRALPNWVSPQWLRDAADYMELAP